MTTSIINEDDNDDYDYDYANLNAVVDSAAA